MTLSKIPLHERPRERLLAQGSFALSLCELLAILLSTGTKGRSVLNVAQDLVEKYGTLEALLEASIAELMEVKGVGRAKAIQLKAAFAIALRTSTKKPLESCSIGEIEAYQLVQAELSLLKQEALIVIFKDVRGKLIGRETIAMGTLSDVLVHPREIFFPAVRNKASSIILAHNHPSGDPTPSIADLELTQHLLKSSRIMGIGLDDHLIIGSNSYVSLKQSGFL